MWHPNGARRLNPVRPRLVPSWDLSVVLRGLQSDPFEPLQSVELSALFQKTALLTALTSIKRVGDLQALSVSDSCLEFGPANSHVILRPRPGYVPKVPTTPFRDQVVTLQAIPSQEGDPNLSLLCPVRALSIYLERTESYQTVESTLCLFWRTAEGESCLQTKNFPLDCGCDSFGLPGHRGALPAGGARPLHQGRRSVGCAGERNLFNRHLQSCRSLLKRRSPRVMTLPQFSKFPGVNPERQFPSCCTRNVGAPHVVAPNAAPCVYLHLYSQRCGVSLKTKLVSDPELSSLSSCGACLRIVPLLCSPSASPQVYSPHEYLPPGRSSLRHNVERERQTGNVLVTYGNPRSLMEGTETLCPPCHNLGPPLSVAGCFGSSDQNNEYCLAPPLLCPDLRGGAGYANTAYQFSLAFSQSCQRYSGSQERPLVVT
ncbi:hypothetical protein QQF64_006101 [Cirrhinus molitorella]|uniref:Uncharacterized protein n=1 Tax=Cirrhinus molitorella TaxID=172907 RepID=A0ABR3ME50_9TELE